MNQNEFLTFQELQNAIENDATESSFKICADFLLIALTSWPTFNNKEPKELLIELNNAIKKPLTFDNLENYLDYLKNDFGHNIYKIEAISLLLEMYDFDRTNNYNKELELESIFDLLTRHYKNYKV